MRKSTTKILSLALLLLLGLSKADHDVSRLGKTYKLVLDLSGPGATTPMVLYNKTKDPSDEPKYTNFLTPLGQRQ
jgi:hypothetical protein